MAAYIKLFPKQPPNCRCGQPAIGEVFNTYNASQGNFCDDCAEKLVKKLNTPAKTIWAGEGAKK